MEDQWKRQHLLSPVRYDTDGSHGQTAFGEKFTCTGLRFWQPPGDHMFCCLKAVESSGCFVTLGDDSQ